MFKYGNDPQTIASTISYGSDEEYGYIPKPQR